MRKRATHFLGSLRRLPVLHHAAHQHGSTIRRQSYILMSVHSALPGAGLLQNIGIFNQGRKDNLLADHT